jgi:hypothetical protein
VVVPKHVVRSHLVFTGIRRAPSPATAEPAAAAFACTRLLRHPTGTAPALRDELIHQVRGVDKSRCVLTVASLMTPMSGASRVVAPRVAREGMPS